MASVRPIPESYYYSGQGRLGIGDRNPDGTFANLVFVGNVTSLSIDIASTKFEHKESMSGQRAVDKTIVQEKNATFTFTSESLKLDLLALGLYGTQSRNIGGTVASEEHVIKIGAAIPLLQPNVANVVVTPSGGGGALIEGTDYQVDEGFGTVYPLATGAGETGDTWEIAYTYGAFDQIDAFTQATPPERYLRFEGLNTVDGSLRLIEIPIAAFDPLTGMEFINEEFGSGEFAGSITPDLTIVEAGKSQFFRERRIGGVGSAAVPALLTAAVLNANPDELVLTFSQPLTSANPTGAGGLVLASSGAAVTATAVAVSGATVEVALSRAMLAGETLSVSYTPPGANPLANANGLVSAFSARPATNGVTP